MPKMQFKLPSRKEFGKNLGRSAMDVGVVGISMLASRKFLDFDVIFKNQPADSMVRKSGGYIKGIGGIILAGMVKNPILKNFLYGVALDGFVRVARQLTTNKETGESFFTAIGADGKLVQIPNSQRAQYQQMMQGQPAAEATVAVAGMGGSGGMSGPGGMGNGVFTKAGTFASMQQEATGVAGHMAANPGIDPRGIEYVVAGMGDRKGK